MDAVLSIEWEILFAFSGSGLDSFEIAALPSQRCALVAFSPAGLGDFELSIVSCFLGFFELKIFGRWLWGEFCCVKNRPCWLIFLNAF